jgi:hypothetical protein
VRVIWIIIAIIAVGIICLAVVIPTFVFLSCENEEVSVEEATSLLYQAVAYAQVRDLDKLCDLASSELMCQHQWEWMGGGQAVPEEPPEIVDTYLLPTVYLKSGGRAPGGRVLVLEGVDGLGKSYQTEFFVFWTTDDWGLKKELAVINGVYWSGSGIAQCDEDGSVTTRLSANPEVE